MDFSRRLDAPELMDTQVFPPDVMEEVLSFLSFTNSYFGGASSVLSPLKTWRRRWTPGQTIRILDVGTGGADVPISLARWARKEKLALEITGIDIVPQIIQLAGERTRGFPEICVREAGLESLDPSRENFDYVTASLFLHHCRRAEALTALAAMDRLARRGLIISDLSRSLASYGAVKALCALLGNRVVKHDGPLSVRRAFTALELQNMAEEAELPYLRVEKRPWFRLSLSGEKI